MGCCRARTQGMAMGSIAAPVERVWSIAADFYELGRWVPTVEQCLRIGDGVRLVRSFPMPDGRVIWAKERMVSLDEDNHCLSYEMVEGNMGLDQYDATIKLSRAGSAATLVCWSFQMSSSSARDKREQEEFLRWGIKRLEEAAAS